MNSAPVSGRQLLRGTLCAPGWYPFLLIAGHRGKVSPPLTVLTKAMGLPISGKSCALYLLSLGMESKGLNVLFGEAASHAVLDSGNCRVQDLGAVFPFPLINPEEEEC